MTLARHLYDEILRHAEATAPRECCGFLVGAPGAAIERVVPVRNAAEEMRAERPDEFTRTAEMGYVMDPKEQLAALRAAESEGKTVRGIYHSHVEVGAYFSAEDRRRALFDGEPMFPDAVYVVADVRARKGVGAKAFVWNPSAAEFVEEPIELD